jgi:hypothetical protein
MNTDMSLQSKLQKAGVIDSHQAQLLSVAASPWWLQLLLGIAAWIAALLMISSFIGPVLAIADNNATRLLAGTTLLAAAIWLATRPQSFLQQMSVAIALAGQGILLYALYQSVAEQDDIPRYACALLSGLLLFSPLNQLHQRISLSIAALCLISLLSAAPALAIVGSVLAALAVLLWCNRPRWAGTTYARQLKSLLEVATLAALGLSVFGQSLLLLDSSDWLGNNLAQAQALYSALGSVLLITTVFWLSRLATIPSRLALLTFSVLLCIALYPASGLLVSTALMLACFYGCSQRWYALCLLAMVLAISQFYYSLALNLLAKSALLALSSLLILSIWLLVQRYQRRLA